LFQQNFDGDGVRRPPVGAVCERFHFLLFKKKKKRILVFYQGDLYLTGRHYDTDQRQCAMLWKGLPQSANIASPTFSEKIQKFTKPVIIFAFVKYQ
jgi:hypothetical protein